MECFLKGEINSHVLKPKAKQGYREALGKEELDLQNTQKLKLKTLRPNYHQTPKQKDTKPLRIWGVPLFLNPTTHPTIEKAMTELKVN